MGAICRGRKAKVKAFSGTQGPATHVEVKVVGVFGIVVRRQDRDENPAAPIADPVQELSLWAGISPVPLDADLAAIGKPEPRNIQGIGAGMLA